MREKIEKMIRKKKSRIRGWIKDIRKHLRDLEYVLKKDWCYDADDIAADIRTTAIWMEEEIEGWMTLLELLADEHEKKD